jgi:N6-adenosine-specific RNA methylase IME4
MRRLPGGVVTYRTIAADPPWDYGVDNQSPSITHGGTGKAQKKPFVYPTMSVEAIAALPVGDLAAADSRLFMWTTNRHLPDSFGVLAAWGFRYRQIVVWHKTGNPTPFGGSIAPNHAEFLLVASKGQPPVVERLKSSVIAAPAAIFGHSAKPECFLDYIEQVSAGPYVELFARRDRFGWDTWGNESLGTAEVAA